MSKRNRVGWRGYMPAIVTPFAEDGALDLKALGGMLEWLHGEGMHGLVLAGTTGEWTSMSALERSQLFKAAGAQMAGKLPLVAGCSAFTAAESIALAEQAELAGFEGLLITPPPYVRPNDEEILDFFRTISAGTALPICIYNWPPGTGIDMSVDLLKRLAEIDGVVAFKQSTANLASFARTVFELSDVVRVFGYMMDEMGLTLLVSRGGDGLMGAGGVLGRTQPDFYNHAWAGRLDEARECGRRDRACMDAWYTPDLIGRFGSGPAILKAALNARGVPGGHVRAPLHDLSAEDAEKVKATLHMLGYV